MNLLIEHVSLLALGHFEQMGHQVILGFNSFLFQPPDDVGTTGHVTDSDDLLQAKITGWDTGINAVSEPVVTFPHGFDDGRGVDTGPGFERILAEDGIVSGEGNFDVFVRLLHVRVQHGQIVVNHAHQFQVDQGLVERSVAARSPTPSAVP